MNCRDVVISRHALKRWHERFCKADNVNLLRLALSHAVPAPNKAWVRSKRGSSYWEFRGIVFVVDPRINQLVTVYRPAYEHFRIAAESKFTGSRPRRSGKFRFRRRDQKGSGVGFVDDPEDRRICRKEARNEKRRDRWSVRQIDDDLDC